MLADQPPRLLQVPAADGGDNRPVVVDLRQTEGRVRVLAVLNQNEAYLLIDGVLVADEAGIAGYIRDLHVELAVRLDTAMYIAAAGGGFAELPPDMTSWMFLSSLLFTSPLLLFC